ncbi:MAG: serine acetyltransferase [bacterium]
MQLPDSTISDLLLSYVDVPFCNDAAAPRLPSKSEVGALCRELLRIVFPGRLSGCLINEDEARRRCAEAANSLECQISRSLAVSGSPECSATALTAEFFSGLPGIRKVIATDLEAAFEGDPAARSIGEILLSYPCVDAVTIQRLAYSLYEAGVQLLPRMMTEWAHERTGIDIHPGASIGTHFFIDHGTGVVIGESCRIGHHVKLYQGVTLGARSFQKDDEGRIIKGGKRHPDVGDHVTVYPYATILGGGTVIGEGSTIGANVFIMHGVPARSLVYLEEGVMRILSKKSGEAATAGV